MRSYDAIDLIIDREQYKEFIEKNIDYDIVVQNYGRDYADEILETMLDAVCCTKVYLVIAGAEIPQAVVKSRLLKLNYSHIEYCLGVISFVLET